MRVRANQVNQYAQPDALYAAEKAAAEREAARSRRKLMEFASGLAGEPDIEDPGITRMEAWEEPQEQNKQQREKNQSRNRQRKAESEDADSTISEWA